MRIAGLSFLNKTNSPATFSIAAYHSPHSLTWRWLLHWCWFRGDERRATWRLLWWDRHNNGIQACLLIPFVGRFWVSTQQPMWYRDLYVRLRDERDRERYETSSQSYNAKLVADATAERGTTNLH